jgi:hypothetical protein
MTGEDRIHRLERQTRDAAKRLHRTTGESVLTLAIVEHAPGQTGVAFATEGATLEEIEFACFILLQKLAEERQVGAAEGCQGCSGSWTEDIADARNLRHHPRPSPAPARLGRALPPARLAPVRDRGAVRRRDPRADRRWGAAVTAAKERPILFSGPMVRALLDGRKTQTRRIVKPQPPEGTRFTGIHYASDEPSSHFFNSPVGPAKRRCPYGEAGDVLWVRETWGLNDYEFETGPIPKTRPATLAEHGLCYRATEDDCEIRNELRWRSSIHMPRWASRLTLAITDIRVQRLHDITDADAEAEGVREPSIGRLHLISPERCGEIDRAKAPALFLWEMLWKSINGAESWDANPWVWAITFEVESQT